MTLHNSQYMVGLDVGSTTVKAIVAEAATDRILWRDYQRHETKQPEKTLEFLQRIETEAETLQHTRAEVVDDHVRLHDELLE